MVRVTREDGFPAAPFALEQQTGVVMRGIARKLREGVAHRRGARLEDVWRRQRHRSTMSRAHTYQLSSFGHSRACAHHPTSAAT